MQVKIYPDATAASAVILLFNEYSTAMPDLRAELKGFGEPSSHFQKSHWKIKIMEGALAKVQTCAMFEAQQHTRC